MAKSRDVEFHTYLAMLRELYRLTQVELAKRLGISQGALSKIERGRMPPNSDVLIKAYRLNPTLFETMFGVE